jgi:hypothetical protein
MSNSIRVSITVIENSTCIEFPVISVYSSINRLFRNLFLDNSAVTSSYNISKGWNKERSLINSTFGDLSVSRDIRIFSFSCYSVFDYITHRSISCSSSTSFVSVWLRTRN